MNELEGQDIPSLEDYESSERELPQDYKQFRHKLLNFRNGLPDGLKSRIHIVGADSVNKDPWGRNVDTDIIPGTYVYQQPSSGYDRGINRFVLTTEESSLVGGNVRDHVDEDGKGTPKYTYDKPEYMLDAERQTQLKAARNDTLIGIKEYADKLREIKPFEIPDLG